MRSSTTRGQARGSVDYRAAHLRRGPLKGFLPQTGTLANYSEPFRMAESAEISLHNDPMIRKLNVCGEDQALQLMRVGMNPKQDIPFLRSILDHAKFVAGDITTKFIEEEYPDGFATNYVDIRDAESVRAAAHRRADGARDCPNGRGGCPARTAAHDGDATPAGARTF